MGKTKKELPDNIRYAAWGANEEAEMKQLREQVEKNKQRTIVFDFGAVVFDASSKNIYKDRFARLGRTQEELDYFLTTVFPKDVRDGSNDGNIAPVIEERVKLFPEWEDDIRAMGDPSEIKSHVRGVIEGMEKVIDDLRLNGDKVVGLTNWHGDLFDTLEKNYRPLLSKFNHIVVSGKVGLRKPDPEIFRHAQKAFGNPDPKSVYFFDDKPANVDMAQMTVGWNAYVVKKSSDTVRANLRL